MNTPICDFVRRYAAHNPARFHMPGHKGDGPTGWEPMDLTEIPGADSLYEAHGIIRESEENAAQLFGSRRTFYSCEGSSLAIRAMILMVRQHAASAHRTPLIWAGRNAHKAFLTAAGLLNMPVRWLDCGGFLSGALTCETLKQAFTDAAERPVAVLVTSPDYLGGMADIRSLAALCHAYGCLLIVDNAHGAYLRFLNESLHPLDLGADLCCDSAHKTLPVITGGAYLHVSRNAPDGLEELGSPALAMFGSTSPSYLILQSLDAFNQKCLQDWQASLQALIPRLKALRESLREDGWRLTDREPMKLTLAPKSKGYTGLSLQNLLTAQDIYPEFADPDSLVLMPAPGSDLDRLYAALKQLPEADPITELPPPLPHPQAVMSIREALLSPQELIPADHSLGRILGSPTVACPPAVSVVCSGERINEEALACFRYYGTKTVSVVRA